MMLRTLAVLLRVAAFVRTDPERAALRQIADEVAALERAPAAQGRSVR
jgi:hypothetical protein